MGLNALGLEFLNALGICLGEVATLGRQETHNLDAETLERTLGIRLDGEPPRWAEQLLIWMGARSVTSIDASSYEGATVIADLNTPIAEELRSGFDTVIDSGTLEHLFYVSTGLANAMTMVRPGGWLIHIAPTNQAAGHGFYQLSPELFFRALSLDNGYALRCVLVRERSQKGVWRRVADPAAVGHRIEFMTSTEAYLYVAAQRIDDRHVLTTAPTQSDFETAWATNRRSPSPPPLAAWRSVAIRTIPASLQRSLRAMVSKPPPEHTPIGSHLSQELLSRMCPWPSSDPLASEAPQRD